MLVKDADFREFGIAHDLVVGMKRIVRHDLREIVKGARDWHANSLINFTFLERKKFKVGDCN